MQVVKQTFYRNDSEDQVIQVKDKKSNDDRCESDLKEGSVLFQIGKWSRVMIK